MRIGIDIGGTNCRGVLVEGASHVVATQRRPTPRAGDELVSTVVDIISVLSSVDGRSTIDGVGVGAPGLITPAGVMRAAANIAGVMELPLAHDIEQATGLRCRVDNDNTCAALAEWRLGAGQNCREVLYVGLGTGIGGGLIIDGALRRGANGFAGEIGHLVINPDGPECPCGRRGCWERYASGSALRMLAAQAGIKAAGEEVVTRARGGDAVALSVIDAWARWLAIGLVNLTNVLDPERIILGGGLVVSFDVLFAPLERWFGALLYAEDHRPRPTVVPASLGDQAGAIGAALLLDE